MTPWNFPFAVPLWMLGPSLLERQHLRVQTERRNRNHQPAARSSCSVEAGFPDGHCKPRARTGPVGEAIVKNPGVNVGVLYRRATRSVRRIQEVSASIPNRIVAAEMGGKNADRIVCGRRPVRSRCECGHS